MPGIASAPPPDTTPAPPSLQAHVPVLPTLFYQQPSLWNGRRSFAISLLAHTAALVFLLASGTVVVTHRQQVERTVVGLVADVSPYVLPPASTRAGGGGGGGDRDKLPASKGALPKASNMQITPPAAVIRNPAPVLPVEPTVVVPPDIRLPQIGPLGDPMSTILGPPSNGPGSGGGIGSGSGGGVGSGRGPGVGPGHGGGIGGGVYRVGGGVSAPRVLYGPDPEFSEEARKAKYQGTVVLLVVVDVNGRTRDIRVLRRLGMGLDERAVAALQVWRFEPARRNGAPVPVEVSVEINFRLY